MATENEKAAPLSTTDPEIQQEAHRPPGKPWMYKNLKIGPLTVPYYASPQFQLVLVAFVCFLCPGMYNAVSGLGGAGQLNHSDISKSNTATYSTFAVVGFFAGSIANRIGLRLTLSFGGFGYTLYVASLLCYNHTFNSGFLIFAGALLGLCAGLLWCAQGAVMMAYPGEDEKGKYISIFWVIFNLGGVIGGLIPLGQNIHNSNSAGSVNDGTYIAFMVLMIVGFLLAWGLVDSKDIVRTDGTRVIAIKNPSWKSELLGLYETLLTDWYIVAFFPMFLASNWFYSYHFNAINGSYFVPRAAALNSILYWAMQMVGAFCFGLILDLKFLKRPARAKLVWFLLLALTMGIWGGGYAFQKTYTRETAGRSKDWNQSGYIGPMFLYMFYGFYDAAFQTCAYWFMGCLSNNSRKLANFAGFYKGIQSAGAAITWALDFNNTPYMNMFASCWGILCGSLLIAAPIIFFKIKDHTDIEEDLRFSDETVADVTGIEVGDVTHRLQQQHTSEKRKSSDV